MSDRHLYKAKRIDNGEWIEGYYIKTENAHLIISDGTICGDNDFLSEPYEYAEIHSSTLCQCTGLKDKNGALIWENDILLGYLDDSYPEDKTYAEVLWWRNGFYTRESGSNDIYEIDDFTEQNFKVIGNIFDNPELLEGGAE